jgi:hypothetical protein
MYGEQLECGGNNKRYKERCRAFQMKNYLSKHLHHLLHLIVLLKLHVVHRAIITASILTYNIHNGINISSYARQDSAA